MNGLFEVPCYIVTDKLDRAAYATDFAWCRSDGIFSIADLSKRIVPHKDYETLWRKRCLEMYNESIYLLEQKAIQIIDCLLTNPEVKFCKIYGSLANGKADKYSDIDIEVDVSECDNSMFVKKLPGILDETFRVIWYDFAPSLMPDQYIVSIAVDEFNPFCIVDLKCTATPHMSSLQKSDYSNDTLHHSLKLWVANCKHFFRGQECSADIHKMGRKVIGTTSENMTDYDILEEVLCRIETNKTDKTANYIDSCRKAFNKKGC
jgi:predicted nucleotidyltransferase